jgi:hypothetical protein
MLLSYSRNYPRFMELESSLPYSQGDATYTLSWARSIQSTPSQAISLRPILILSFHLQQVPTNGIFPSGFHHWKLGIHLSSPTHVPRATCPAHICQFQLIVQIMSVEEFKSWSSSSCNFLQSPVISSLRPKQLPQNEFSPTRYLTYLLHAAESFFRS